ncbi:winged helix-turn-helix domain-containing protein [Natrialbaceae archaeon GCM10025810]
MRLTRPTDFDILEILTEGRNVPANIAARLDKQQGYISGQLPKLADQGLVKRIGPAERAGLYELTERGEAALALRSEYDSADDFEALIDDYLETDD